MHTHQVTGGECLSCSGVADQRCCTAGTATASENALTSQTWWPGASEGVKTQLVQQRQNNRQDGGGV
ncbi:hypothetical protein WJX82_007335 [Trebouxia sp. C0006]